MFQACSPRDSRSTGLKRCFLPPQSFLFTSITTLPNCSPNLNISNPFSAFSRPRKTCDTTGMILWVVRNFVASRRSCIEPIVVPVWIQFPARNYFKKERMGQLAPMILWFLKISRMVKVVLGLAVLQKFPKH